MSAETQRPLFAVLVTVALLLWPLRCVAASPPAWAYPVNPPGFQPSPLPDIPLQVPGSRERLRGSQLRDLFYAPDWHPQEQPPPPPIVATGRKPEVYACGYCHRANGAGGPENASLAGLPYDYIVQQMGDFRSGAPANACRSCHGRDLGGSGVIPGIAGRSPSYIFRQLFDIQSGVRAGAAVSPMRDMLRGRSEDDLLAIAAYLASVR
jgi:cytochrome c553